LSSYQHYLSNSEQGLVHLTPPSSDSLEFVERPVGYRVAEIFNVRAASVLDGKLIEGFGSGDELTAKAKAISELFERYAMLTSKGGVFKTISSNGWAAHFDAKSAITSATYELIERETALMTWLQAGPYYEIPKTLWPTELSSWASKPMRAEFHRARAFVTLGPRGACVSVLLFNSQAGCLAGHASGHSLKSSILSGFLEALRSAHAVLRLEDFAEVLALHQNPAVRRSYGPGANALAYAYGVPLPKLDFVEASEVQIQEIWATHLDRSFHLMDTIHFSIYKVHDRFVASVYSPEVMPIFWGPTCLTANYKNQLPHFVG
jgi:hypothetical protein